MPPSFPRKKFKGPPTHGEEKPNQKLNRGKKLVKICTDVRSGEMSAMF
jgi:hypothetical protein